MNKRTERRNERRKKSKNKTIPVNNKKMSWQEEAIQKSYEHFGNNMGLQKWLDSGCPSYQECRKTSAFRPRI